MGHRSYHGFEISCQFADSSRNYYWRFSSSIDFGILSQATNHAPHRPKMLVIDSSLGVLFKFRIKINAYKSVLCQLSFKTLQ